MDVDHRVPLLERRVQLDATELRVAEAGSGPPLLLINGIGAGLELWRPLAARLAQNRRVIMFDAPGAGRSPVARRPLRMPDLARVLTLLLDEIGLARVDVLGYSWGGALAQQLARDAPERVRRLVLAATTPGLGGTPPSLAAALLMSTPLPLLLGRPAALNTAVFGGAGAPDDADRQEVGSQLPHAARPLGYVAQLYTIMGWSSLRWLDRIGAPTLVLAGGDDPLVPLRNGRLLAGRIPYSRLDVHPKAGHLWLIDHAAQSASVVDEFLAS